MTIDAWARIAQGALADVSCIALGTHTGTHVDPPCHFIPGGRTVDQLDLSVCTGRAEVVDCTAIEFGSLVDASTLEKNVPAGAERVLLKTRNSGLWQRESFEQDFIALSPDAAEWLVSHGVKLIGIDYLSIAPFKDPATVHRTLLGAEVIILEGLDLGAVQPGTHTLFCLPLRLQGLDGAPARAILVDEGEGIRE